MRLRYWIESALDITAGTLIGSAAYAVVMNWQSGDFSIQECLAAAALFTVVFGGLMALLMNIAVYSGMLPVCLSFGSTRKEALLGMQLYQLIPALACSGLAALVFTFVKGNHEVQPVMAFCIGMASFLIMGALGSVAGMRQTKYGNKACAAAVFVGIDILALIVVAVVVIVRFSTEGQIKEALFSPVFYGSLLLAGIAVHCLCLIQERKAINQHGVKL